MHIVAWIPLKHIIYSEQTDQDQQGSKTVDKEYKK